MSRGRNPGQFFPPGFAEALNYFNMVEGGYHPNPNAYYPSAPPQRFTQPRSYNYRPQFGLPMPVPVYKRPRSRAPRSKPVISPSALLAPAESSVVEPFNEVVTTVNLLGITAGRPIFDYDITPSNLGGRIATIADNYSEWQPRDVEVTLESYAGNDISGGVAFGLLTTENVTWLGLPPDKLVSFVTSLVPSDCLAVKNPKSLSLKLGQPTGAKGGWFSTNSQLDFGSCKAGKIAGCIMSQAANTTSPVNVSVRVSGKIAFRGANSVPNNLGVQSLLLPNNPATVASHSGVAPAIFDTYALDISPAGWSTVWSSSHYDTVYALSPEYRTTEEEPTTAILSAQQGAKAAVAEVDTAGNVVRAVMFTNNWGGSGSDNPFGGGPRKHMVAFNSIEAASRFNQTRFGAMMTEKPTAVDCGFVSWGDASETVFIPAGTVVIEVPGATIATQQQVTSNIADAMQGNFPRPLRRAK